MLTTNAPAKINLYLHVTGKRDDGYHLLDSLVVFTGVGDVMKLEEADEFAFVMDGPMAPALAGGDPEQNLVVRAARGLAAAKGRELKVKLTLTKNLPIASGIGGGSTDAAAALRLLSVHWGLEPRDPDLFRIAARLGQDIPCCIDAETCYFRGIGDQTDPGPELPHTDIVLVNPGVALPTPAVFKARTGAFTPARFLSTLPESPQELADMLSQRSNSLTAAAITLCPDIEMVLDALRGQQDCLLARMSGSGATCFGLFPDRASARQAAADLYTRHPEWWVVQTNFPTQTRVLMGGVL